MFSILGDLILYFLVNVLFDGVFRGTGLVVLRLATRGRVAPGSTLNAVLSDPMAKREDFTYQLNGATFLYSDYVPVVGVGFWFGVAVVAIVAVIVHHVAVAGGSGT
jgi:hypothetical protein